MAACECRTREVAALGIDLSAFESGRHRMRRFLQMPDPAPVLAAPADEFVFGRLKPPRSPHQKHIAVNALCLRRNPNFFPLGIAGLLRLKQCDCVAVHFLHVVFQVCPETIAQTLRRPHTAPCQNRKSNANKRPIGLYRPSPPFDASACTGAVQRIFHFAVCWTGWLPKAAGQRKETRSGLIRRRAAIRSSAP